MTKSDYDNTARIISLLEEFLVDLGDYRYKDKNHYEGEFSKSSRKLAARIFLEWAKSLKKSVKPKDKKLSDLLLGLVKYLE